MSEPSAVEPSAVEAIVEDVAAIDLAAGLYTARFLPGLGMVGSSLTWGGAEHVSFAGVEAHRSGSITGIPLLHPWANRLSRLSYEVDGVGVDLLDAAPPLRLHDGLAIHGTMTAAPGWHVEAVLADRTRALAQARFVFGDHPSHLRSFPFPHELVVFVELSDLGLRVTTEVRNTGTRSVPVAFGWHPCLMLPGVARDDLAVVLPDREHLGLDGRHLPTGTVEHEAAGATVLGASRGPMAFDDCYRLPAADAAVTAGNGGISRVLALEAARPLALGAPGAPEATGARRRIEVELDDRYGYAQVYAPHGSATVALEPMTGPVDALVSGEHRLVPPGEQDRATFTIRIRDVTGASPGTAAHERRSPLP